MSALVNPHAPPAEQRSARNRARSVDVGPRNQSVPARSAFVPQQVVPVHEYRAQQRAQPAPMAAPSGNDGKDQNNFSVGKKLAEKKPFLTFDAFSERTGKFRQCRKINCSSTQWSVSTISIRFILIVRTFIESFKQASPSGRVPYSSLPGIIQRFGIPLTENDVLNAAKELEYNGKHFLS